MNKATMVGKVNTIKNNWNVLELELLVTTHISKITKHNSVAIKVSGKLKTSYEEKIKVGAILEVHGSLEYEILPSNTGEGHYCKYYIEADEIIERDIQMNELFAEELAENEYLSGSPDYYNRILLSGTIVSIKQTDGRACSININVDDDIFTLTSYTAKASYIKKAYKPGDFIYAKCCYQSRISSSGFEHKALIAEFYTKKHENSLTEEDFECPENPTSLIKLNVDNTLYNKMNKLAYDSGLDLPRYIIQMLIKETAGMDDNGYNKTSRPNIVTIPKEAYQAYLNGLCSVNP